MASDLAKRTMARYRSLQDRGIEQGVESVIYRPLGGTARTIDAIVDRSANVAVMHGRAGAFHVTVLNDATLGIASATLDRGSDLIDVAEVAGGTPASRGIQQITDQDGDWLRLLVI